jgi:hypothetical protein
MGMGSIIGVGPVGQKHRGIFGIPRAVPTVSNSSAERTCVMEKLTEGVQVGSGEQKDNRTYSDHNSIGTLGIDPRELARSIKAVTEHSSSSIISGLGTGLIVSCAMILVASTVWNVFLNQQQLELQQEVRDRIKTLESKIDQVEVLRKELRERLGMISRMDGKQDT